MMYVPRWMGSCGTSASSSAVQRTVVAAVLKEGAA